jgi:hypothetical protein
VLRPIYFIVFLSIEQVTLQHYRACAQHPDADQGQNLLHIHEHEEQELCQACRHSGAATETWTLLLVCAMGHESEQDTTAFTVITTTVPLLVCGPFATTTSSPGVPVSYRFAPLSYARLGLRPLLVGGKDGW